MVNNIIEKILDIPIWEHILQNKQLDLYLKFYYTIIWR